MDVYIRAYLKHRYNVETKIVRVKRALHLGGRRYQYSVFLAEDPLAYFSGIYNANSDIFSEISMNFILFNSQYRKLFRKMVSGRKVVVNSYIYAPEVFNASDIRANTFCFGFNYLDVGDSFEVKNRSMLIDSFEVQNSGLDRLLSQWDKKIR
jgi:hypothetical protein